MTRAPAALSRRLRAAGLLVTVLSALTVAAVVDGFDFEDQAQAERYHSLIAELRCPKCLNINLAGSDAPIAVDLRRAVRRMLEAGRSDDEIRAHLRERYGDFILYDPPFEAATAALWLAPLALLAIAGLVLRRLGTRRDAVVLDAEDRERLRALGVDEP